MGNDPLSLYISEVLGPSIPVQEVVPPIVDVAPVVVETEELTEFTRSLLHKILASVQLKDWRQQFLGDEPIPSHHRLRFSGDSCSRTVNGDEVRWTMPSLSQMLGDGPEVNTHKRAVWSLLKDFQKELGRQ